MPDAGRISRTDVELVDRDGNALGTLRVTADAIRWKAAGSPDFLARSLQDFLAWIEAAQPNVDAARHVARSSCRAIEVHHFDWSGAGAHHANNNGIVLASGVPGQAPALQAGFSRIGALDHAENLALRASNEGRFLLGLDFAFSFPFAAKGNAFPDATVDRMAFWQAVHGLVWSGAAAPAQMYVNAYADHFHWYDGAADVNHVGPHFIRALRLTEQAAQQYASPASVFRVVGPNQVGKGSLCGIAMLVELIHRCRQKQLPLAIWPFFYMALDGTLNEIVDAQAWARVPEPCLIVAETYPAIYWGIVLPRKGRPWRDPNAWLAVRNHYALASPPPTPPQTVDEGDSLIGWYAMCDTDLGLPTQAHLAADAQIVAQEGWILGA